MGIQMLCFIALFLWIGRKLDIYFEIDGYLTALFSVIGVIFAIIYFIRRITRMY